MPAVSSSWLVGSVTIAQQDFTANGFACSIPAGTYYLRSQNGNLGLTSMFDSEVEDETGVVSDGSVIRRDRLFETNWLANVAINWGAATVLRDLLGFTGNLAAGTQHVATNISPLLWSPGYPATPKTIPGVSGYTKPHQAKSKSDDGSQVYVYHFGTETWQDLEWSHIYPSRLRTTGTTAAQGGTFHQFYQQCLMLGSRFFHYEQVTEDSSSTADVTWPTGLGPYVIRGDMDGDWYERRVKGADISSPLKLQLQVVDEVS
jgi:hypothetical protein